MADQWAYITVKVNKDDVPAAMKEAKSQAVAQLGASVEFYEKSWTPGWLCTAWRLRVPDIPPGHP